ncbi:MAG: C39 family peptidase [Thermoleophilia bacterium]|nr:C39 family peptidase [Thermoleophilia bacterium]
MTTSSSGSGSGGAVGVPSSSIAPRTQYDYWTKHIAQFAGKYLPDGPTMRPNCGPASVTMALRMVGLDIPGFNGQNSEAVLDKARVLATGANNVSVGTTDSELENLITKSGARWSESTNFNEVTNWVKQGIPVVLSGNPAYGWNDRYSNDQVYKFNGGHWVTVSGYDQATGHYIVNDPLSQIGPIYVSEAELKSYNKAHGNLGIAVFR